MFSPLDRLRQKSRKWTIILFGGLLLLMVGLGLTANLLFFIGVVILAGYVSYGVSKEIRCPFCGLFDPVGMWRLELEVLFKRRSVCPQCRHELKNN
jgi:hypothetical protein